MKSIGFASEVELQDDSSYFVCFVQFVDRIFRQQRTIHELHETHEVTQKVLNSTFEAKPKLSALLTRANQSFLWLNQIGFSPPSLVHEAV